MDPKDIQFFSLQQLHDTLRNKVDIKFEVSRMTPLFSSEEEFEAFKKRHASHSVKKADLQKYKGNATNI